MSDHTNNEKLGSEKDAGTPASFLHRTDLWIALVLFAICGALFYETTRWETVMPSLSQNIPPTFFPRLVLGAIVVFTLLLPCESYFAAKRGVNLDEGRADRIEPITWITAAVLVAIVAIMPWLGTLLTMVLASVGLPILWGERRPVVIALFAVLFPLIVTVLFTEGLKVYFLPGLLEPFMG
ncbi:MAG: tripartite tricarboxylate transporter TctB family protein [Alphaproteobacteria bacterium]